jgi:hypothetical protein
LAGGAGSRLIFVNTRRGDEIKEHIVDNMMQSGLLPTEIITEIILDNAANISIMRPLLLTNIRVARKKIGVKGVGGIQIRTLEGFLKFMQATRQGKHLKLRPHKSYVQNYISTGRGIHVTYA